MSEKCCTKCLETKPLSEFGKKTNYPDGHQYWCRACMKADREKRVQAVAAALAARPELLPAAKNCRRCEVLRPLSDFPKNRLRGDGRDSQCRACRSRRRLAQSGGLPIERFADPDLKRCPRCREVKSRRHDFFLRHRPGGSGREVTAYCKACSRDSKRDWWAATREERRRRSREKYRKRAAFYAEYQRRWREAHPEAAKARDKQFYRRWREKLLLKAKEYRKANRDRVDARIREWRKRHPDWQTQYRARNRERIRHYARVKYWENPEKRRLQQRLYSQSRPRRPGDGRRPTVSLDVAFGDKGTMSRMDRVADTRIVSPERAAVEAASLQAVRAFVAQQITDREREILEAFADCFSVEGAAELLGITPGEVEATLTAIRSRAAALGSSVDGQES